MKKKKNLFNVVFPELIFNKNERNGWRSQLVVALPRFPNPACSRRSRRGEFFTRALGPKARSIARKRGRAGSDLRREKIAALCRLPMRHVRVAST